METDQQAISHLCHFSIHLANEKLIHIHSDWQQLSITHLSGRGQIILAKCKRERVRRAGTAPKCSLSARERGSESSRCGGIFPSEAMFHNGLGRRRASHTGMTKAMNSSSAWSCASRPGFKLLSSNKTGLFPALLAAGEAQEHRGGTTPTLLLAQPLVLGARHPGQGWQGPGFKCSHGTCASLMPALLCPTHVACTGAGCPRPTARWPWAARASTRSPAVCILKGSCRHFCHMCGLLAPCRRQ